MLRKSHKERNPFQDPVAERHIVEVVQVVEVEMVAEETDRRPAVVVDLSHASLEIPIRKEDRLKRGPSKRIRAFVSTS